MGNFKFRLKLNSSTPQIIFSCSLIYFIKKCIFLILLCSLILVANSQNKFDTMRCKVFYNKHEINSYSLKFDCGDQISFTPNFFILRNDKISDTGLVFSDTIADSLNTVSNHLTLYSKRFQRYLRKHKHPAKNKYNGFHFYLYEAVIIVDNNTVKRNANWPNPKSKFTSEYKFVYITTIHKILTLTPKKVKKISNKIWINKA